MDPNTQPLPQQPVPEHQPTVPEQQPSAPVAPEVQPAPPPAPSAAPAVPVTPAVMPPIGTPAPAATTPAPSQSPGSPAIADDVDVIEREWVDQAEKVINTTKNDPYIEEEAIEDLQADYLKKRYGHDVKPGDDPQPPAAGTQQ